MLVSHAEGFFIVVVGFVACALSDLGCIHVLPRLPVRVPPVLLCIGIGCAMRLASSAMLATPSADALVDASANKPGAMQLYSDGVVRVVSSPAIAACLACVGMLIGSHLDVEFLRQHTRALICMTVCSLLGAYLATMGAGLLCWAGAQTLHVHLIATTAMERASSEALATIADSNALSSPHASTVFFARSTLFVGATMDVTAVVMFVLSMAMAQPGAGAGHLLEVVLGTAAIVVVSLAVGRGHSAVAARLLAWLTARHASPPQWLIYAAGQHVAHERGALLVIGVLVFGGVVLPDAELLLAAMTVGVALSHKAATLLQQQDDTDPECKPDTSDHSLSRHTAAAHGSIVTAIDAHSLMIYSVMFSIIGLRIDAAQLLGTLASSPKVALLLFSARLAGLVAGAAAGAAVGGCPQHGRWRGFGLVTRIAVSIILLQKIEDMAPVARPMVHAAIGAVLIDMCVGPLLLQAALRHVERDAGAVAAGVAALGTDDVASMSSIEHQA